MPEPAHRPRFGLRIMITPIELLLTPTELDKLDPGNLADTACVVFDILRATSTIVTALHQGAREILLVEQIEEALALHTQNPKLLLAGERGGKRILRSLTGSIDFDLGNSPREFTPQTVAGRSIVMTTTNGTRALQICQGAHSVFAASFLNLGATAAAIAQSAPARVLMVCAGTGSRASYEDALGAGALLSRLPDSGFDTSTDACLMAKHLHAGVRNRLVAAFAQSTNGRRLAANPDLREDLEFCARPDVFRSPVRVVGNVARL